jgi:multidrug efflux pump subunit AcrA (membrane-fusion protein)
VNAFVDEVDIGKVKLGQRVTFNVDAFPAQDFAGSVSAIYPSATIQDNVVKYVVAIAVDDEDRGLLRPEMTASVRIQLETRTVLAIPARAIRQDAGRSVVHVVKGGETEIRPIRIGWRDGPWAEIADGLNEGERILLSATITTGEQAK